MVTGILVKKARFFLRMIINKTRLKSVLETTIRASFLNGFFFLQKYKIKFIFKKILIFQKNVFTLPSTITYISWAKIQKQFFEQDKRERPYGGLNERINSLFALRICDSHTYGGVSVLSQFLSL